MEKANLLKKEAQKIEEAMGLRKFGNCPICDDMISSDGKCVYCDWNDTWSAEKTCEVYNNYWSKGQVKEGYEREPKKVEDFIKTL